MTKLQQIVQESIDFYNEQRIALSQKEIDQVNYDTTKINWTRATLNNIIKNRKYSYNDGHIVYAMYRPFVKQYLYYSHFLNEMTYQIPRLFPTMESENKVICITGNGEGKDFSCLLVDNIPDVQLKFNGQCFPLYYYEKKDGIQGNLFENNEDEYIRHDGISDFILKEAQPLYGKKVNKEDIFYYIYGFLHSRAYRVTFDVNLKKELPRVPLVDKAEDFWAFSKSGRELAEIHLNYEKIAPYEGCRVRYKSEENVNYRVEKMKFRDKEDKSKIVYNNDIDIENIPERAYEYVVNGKSAIEWIMDRYVVKTDKKSGITNDANDWALEVGDERYILDLLLRIVNVSLLTLDIVEGLPKLKFD